MIAHPYSHQHHQRHDQHHRKPDHQHQVEGGLAKGSLTQHHPPLGPPIPNCSDTPKEVARNLLVTN